MATTPEEDAALLQQLETRGREVTPEQVLAAAADPDHPWHSRITWDESKAAYDRRIEQAKKIITGARIWVVRSRTHVNAFEPAFVRTTTRSVFRATRAVSQSAMQKRVLADHVGYARGSLTRGLAIAEAYNKVDEFRELIRQMLAEAGIDLCAEASPRLRSRRERRQGDDRPAAI